MEARHNTTKILQNAREEARQREENNRLKKQAYDQKLLAQFERDKQNRTLIEKSMDAAAERERENERIIVSKLINSEATYSQKKAMKDAQNVNRAERAKLRSELVNDLNARRKEEEKKAEDKRILEYCNKINQLKSKRANSVNM